MKKTEATQQVTQFVTTQVSRVEAYVRSHYGMPEFKVSLSYTRGNRSWGGIRGGQPFILLSIERHIKNYVNNTPMTFFEYPSFSEDLHIGTLQNVSWMTALTALITHEIAHAVQYYNPLKAVDAMFSSRSEVSPLQLKGHKNLWKAIYKDLRGRFINNLPVITAVDTSKKPVATTIAKPIPKTVPVTKPVGKKTWTVVKTKVGKYLKVQYVEQSTGKVLLTLLDRLVESILVLNTETNEWIETHSLDRVEVRKQYLFV